jgi:hypothetical protein
MNTFIRFHKFWIFNNINYILYFDIPNNFILKIFLKCHISYSLWTFWLGTQIWNMISEFFLGFFSQGNYFKKFTKKLIE